MLIANVDIGSGQSRRVAVTGSCRTYEPFLAAAGPRGYRLVHQQYTPFTYSAGEAEQYFDFSLGKVKISSFDWPLVFSDKRTTVPSEELKEILANVDICVAEISTLDQVSCVDRFYNFNELELQFVRGQGKAHGLWWRELTDRRRRKASIEAVNQVLKARTLRGEDASASVAKFLTDMRFETLNEEGLAEYLGRMTAKINAKWLFVAHLNISEQETDAIPERRLLLEVLRRVAKKLGHDVFDPTPTVVEFGYHRALLGNGADRHHYTPEFKPVLGAALVSRIDQVVKSTDGPLAGEMIDPLVSARTEAFTAMSSKRWAEAADAWKQVLGKQPASLEAHVLGVEALSHLGRWSEAEDLAARAIVLHQENLWAAHIHAGLPGKRQDWAEADRRWANVRKRFPDDPAGYANGASALLNLGKPDDAAPLIDILVQRHPSMPDGWIGLATLAARRSDWREANILWRTVREKFPHLASGFGFGAEALARLGEIETADAIALDGAGRFPQDMWLLQVYAGLATLTEDYAKAALRWAAVRDTFPSEPIGYEQCGHCLARSGRLFEAQNEFATAALRFPDRPEPLLALAELHIQRGAWAEAALSWADVCRRFPAREEGYFRGALALRKVGLEMEATHLENHAGTENAN